MSVVSSSVLLLPNRAMQDPGIQGANCCKKKLLRIHHLFLMNPSIGRGHCVRTKAATSDQNPKRKSVICTDCDGNGAVLCSQCKGSGVNSVDIFNGQFKAGDSCWLCGGKKDMLCGNCNGAGFIGGFMSTFDE